MNWRLTLLGIVVCVATALVVSFLIGRGDNRQVRRVSTIVRLEKPHTPESRSTEGAPPVSRSPSAAGSRSAGNEKQVKQIPPATRTPRPPHLSLAGKTIVVDPGHNGGNASDPEAINRLVPAGANGTTKPCNTTGTETNDGSLTEAQFNWDVAQDLVPRLKHLGARVVLTRHDNEGVGPCVDERAAIANRAHADAAVSIHADGNYAEGAHGFDVIHPSPEESVAPLEIAPSLQLAEAERNALVGAGIPPANYVGENGLDERSDLAGLNLAKVPAVLVELGNMRDEEEAVKLEDPAYRHELADALAAGIVSFLAP
jgi:N-acetylmuramoyl-L-alanine amidase